MAPVSDDDVGAVLDVTVDDPARVDAPHDGEEAVEELAGELTIGVLRAVAPLDVLDEEGVAVEEADEAGDAGGSSEGLVDVGLAADEPRADERAEEPAAGLEVLEHGARSVVLEDKQRGPGAAAGAELAVKVLVEVAAGEAGEGAGVRAHGVLQSRERFGLERQHPCPQGGEASGVKV